MTANAAQPAVEKSTAAAIMGGIADGSVNIATWAGPRLVNLATTVFFPFVLMYGADFLSPASRKIVSFSWASLSEAYSNPTIAWTIVAQVALVAVWAFFNFWPVIQGNARTGFLQMESFVSIVAGFIVAGVVIWSAARQGVPYYMVVPFLTSLADAIGTPILSINNAAQLSTKGRDHGAIGVSAPSN